MQKNPFIHVQPWMHQILSDIKKDIKTEHLGSNKIFYQKHFGSKPVNKLLLEEIFSAYEKELLEGDEELIDWAVNRWVYKHGDLYRHFAEKLGSINPNFAEIESLSDDEADQVLSGSEEFGAMKVFLFSRLNGVVFSEAVFEKLKTLAEKESEAEKKNQEEEESRGNLVQEVERLRRELSRAKEKYESKLAGIQRKVQVDTEAFKKQIRSLQKRLIEK